MYSHRIQLRVRYGETDRMGYCYYGNYAEYYEVGRVETLRSLGFSYKKLEDEGVLLPVLEFTIKYFKPAYYDDELQLVTQIDEMQGARIRFSYKMYNNQEQLLNEGQTTLVFVSSKNGRPTSPPADLVEAMKTYLH